MTSKITDPLLKAVFTPPTTAEEAISYAYALHSNIFFYAPWSSLQGLMCLGLAIRSSEDVRKIVVNDVLVEHFVTRYGLAHLDDIERLIRDGSAARSWEVAFDLDQEAARYVAHWKSLGVDPSVRKVRNSADSDTRYRNPVPEYDMTLSADRARQQVARAPEQPRRTFWAKLGDLIYGPR